jgi:integral membrane protein
VARWFSVVAAAEAVTWAGLLAGMYLKYVTRTTELGVRIFGSLHGAAFIVYIALTALVAVRLKWPLRWTTLLALAASVPPFATVAFEVWARRTGRLPRPVADPPPRAAAGDGPGPIDRTAPVRDHSPERRRTV